MLRKLDLLKHIHIGVVGHRRVLEKFHIGDLDVKDPAAQSLLQYEPDLAEGQFYYVLKQRVEKLLKDNKVREVQT